MPGILQTYQTCVSQIQLYGPTNFAPIINHVARFGAAAQREVGAKVRHSGKYSEEGGGGGMCKPNGYGYNSYQLIISLQYRCI